MKLRVQTVIFTLGFLLCLVGLSTIVTHSWELPCEISCDELNVKFYDLEESHECCGQTNTSSCDLFQGCCSTVPGSSVPLISKVENKRFGILAITSVDAGEISFSNFREFIPESTETGPPQPLFLKNLSMLC